MSARKVSRRGFVIACGAAAAGASLSPRLTGARAEASLPLGMPDDVVQLNSNENPYGLSPVALQALGRSGGAGSRYPDALDDEARAAIAKRHGVASNRVVLGCGSSDILRMADAAYLGSGKSVVAAEPTFEAVLLYAGVLHSSPKKVPLTSDFRHDLPAMAAACDEQDRARLRLQSEQPDGHHRLRRRARDVRRPRPADDDDPRGRGVRGFRGGSELSERARSHRRAPQRHRRADVLEDLRDGGLRLGYAVASESAAEALARQASWNNTNATALTVARAVVADADLVPAQRRLLNGTKRQLCDALDRDGRRHIPSQANFLMIDVGRDVTPVIAAFRVKGILVGRKFPSLPNWLRVSVGTPEQMASFLAALREIVPAKAAA